MRAREFEHGDQVKHSDGRKGRIAGYVIYDNENIAHYLECENESGEITGGWCDQKDLVKI
jgi:hypothetical protein